LETEVTNKGRQFFQEKIGVTPSVLLARVIPTLVTPLAVYVCSSILLSCVRDILTFGVLGLILVRHLIESVILYCLANLVNWYYQIGPLIG